MCKGSVHASKTMDAQTGESYQVSDGGHAGYGIGVLHREGEGRTGSGGAIACAACIKTPTTITLQGLTPAMQDLYKVGPTANAVFMPNEAAPLAMQDVVEFSDSDVRVPLIAFANTPVRIMIAVPVEQAARERHRVDVTA